MTDVQLQAVRYLASSNASLWHWTADGEAVAWADGTTIAFRREIEAVIERMVPHGLPRFGAIVLLLGACRDGWQQSSGRRAIAGMAATFAHWQPNPHRSLVGLQSGTVDVLVWRAINSMLQELDAVSRLPVDVRHGTLAKSILAETVFEPGAKRLAPDHAAFVADALTQGIDPTALAASVDVDKNEPLSQFARESESLQPGLGLVSAEALALRARTGFDEPVLPADLELPDAEQTRKLLTDLSHDREFAGLARLAQRLMAAVHVPRSLHSREELPVGGVSDLSNRGPLDRLLVSELANDTLTLAVRVALNEALYLRRESPPRDPPHRRALLLDCGIRMWGIPRAFAIASALAFAATTDGAAQVVAFRAAGKEVEPLDLTTRGGLVSCMAALGAWPHPGDSLQPFLDAVANPVGVAASASQHADAILITHPDVLDDPEFSTALARLAGRLLYIATVDRDGHFQMFAISSAGRKRVTDAELDLKLLFAGTAASTSVVSTPRQSLPAIWSVDRFPLRLPCVLKPQNTIAGEFGLIGVSRDGRLLHWESEVKHARQLTMTLPRQPLLGLYHVPALQSVCAVFAHRREKRACLIRAEPATGKVDVTELWLAGPPARGCCVAGSAVCLISDEAVEAFSLANGAPMASLSLVDSTRWSRDRFFENQTGWFALAYDGHALRLERAFPRTDKPPIMLFDFGREDGPFALRADGSLLASFSDEPLNAGPFTAAAVLGVSVDGSRIAVRADSRSFVLDLKKAGYQWKEGGISWPEFLVGPQFRWARRFPATGPGFYRSIYVDSSQQLCLVSAENHRWQLTTNSLGKHVFVRTWKDAAIYPFHFQPVKPPAGVRITLHEAQWADGSRAFIDSRRLLHLKSSDPDVPELSLVLSSQEVSGWSSDGRLFGSRRFLPHGEPAPDKELAEIIRQYVLRLQ